VDILELVRLLDNSLKTISVNLNSEKDWVDYISVLSPMVIGVIALILTVISNNRTLKSQKDNSTMIAKVEIATKLRYEWLSNVREISAKLAGELDCIAHLSTRVNNIENQIKHYKENIKSDVSDLVQKRAIIYEEIMERKRTSSVMCYKMLTYLNESKHDGIFSTIGEFSLVLRKEGQVKDIHEFSNVLSDFIQKIHTLLDEEWKDLLNYPLGS
jgi:hypothetical protein